MIDGAAHYYRTYETADGKHFAVGAMEPQFYAELCARLGVDVPQEDTLEAWAAHGDTMAARFREKTRAEWEAELVTPQSCASPVLGLAEAPDHPHSRARGTFVTVDGVVQPAPAPRFSRTAAVEPSPPSLPGDHTLAVLVELGLESAELLQTGVARQSRGRLIGVVVLTRCRGSAASFRRARASRRSAGSGSGCATRRGR